MVSARLLTYHSDIAIYLSGKSQFLSLVYPYDELLLIQKIITRIRAEWDKQTLINTIRVRG